MLPVERCEFQGHGNLVLEHTIELWSSFAGCSTGEIYLWHFGQRMASAGYTPLPASAPSIPSTSSLFSAPSKCVQHLLATLSVDSYSLSCDLNCKTPLSWHCRPRPVALYADLALTTAGNRHTQTMPLLVVDNVMFVPQGMESTYTWGFLCSVGPTSGSPLQQLWGALCGCG